MAAALSAGGAGTAAQRAGVLARELAASTAAAPPHTGRGARCSRSSREFSLPRAAVRRADRRRRDGSGARALRDVRRAAEYCRRVASAVGLICVEIFGYRDPRRARLRGEPRLALQLTNIVRDVAADLSAAASTCRRRICGGSRSPKTTCGAGVVTPAWRRCCASSAPGARVLLRRGRRRLPRADAHSLVAAEIMGGIYFEILRRIERRATTSSAARIRVPRPRRRDRAARLVAGAARALASCAAGPSEPVILRRMTAEPMSSSSAAALPA